MVRAGARHKRSKRGTSAKREAEGSLARLGRLLTGFLFGREVEGETARHLQEIKGLALAGLSTWLLVALASYYTPYDDVLARGRNWGGQVGFYLATWVFMAVGFAGYLLAALGVGWGAVLVTRKRVAFPSLRVFGGLCLLLAVGFLLQLGLGERYAQGYASIAAAPGRLNTIPYGPGGWLALELIGPDPRNPFEIPILIAKFGLPGLWILLVIVATVSFMLATEMAFYPAALALAHWIGERKRSRGESAVRAVAAWLRGLFVGLWSFLRGSDVEPASAGASARSRTRGKAPAHGAGQPKAGGYDDDDEDAFERDWGDRDDEDDEEEEGEEEKAEEADEEGAAEDLVDDDLRGCADDDLGGAEEPDTDEESEEDDEIERGDEGSLRRRAPARSAAKKGARSVPVSIVDGRLGEPPVPPIGEWRYPPLDLLEPPTGRTREDEQKIEESASMLERSLASFRVEASVVGAKVGPTVTLFELEVAQGTRMNKVTQLSSEIAAALRAKSVRIIAPIPGKATIGIEVPNKTRRIVRISELITQQAYDKKFAALPLFLGVDTEGDSVVEDLARMPHLMIAGTTGSGKSVCINTVLASLLLTRSPHDVQLILIDPKMVELQTFAEVPHLMLPVVTDARQATNVLLWAVEKMEGRYELFKDAGVRHIKGYNSLGEESLRERLGERFREDRTPRHVPYIVIVVDEMADLMMVSKKEAEMAITRLAQKSRAVGIHVIVATQRPSTDVITGVLKGNLPTRIAFQVASKVDSRVILDAMGAEKLLGQGDMLYTPPSTSLLKRVQGALVEDHELQALVDFVCQESAPAFSQELVQSATGETRGEGGGTTPAQEDDLWDEAVRIIIKSKRGSASLLQRALGIGYTRASRLIDLMTAEGIVGEHKGSKAREVLYTMDDWEDRNGMSPGPGGSDE